MSVGVHTAQGLATAAQMRRGLSSSSAVKSPTELAMPASEKNAAEEGTLANAVQKQEAKVGSCLKRMGFGSLNSEVFWEVGDHNLLHSQYGYVPAIPADSNFVFLVNVYNAAVYFAVAFPVDYENRIFIYKGITGKWSWTEGLTAQN